MPLQFIPCVNCLRACEYAQLTMYIFGIVGVWTFAGYLTKLPEGSYEYPTATFDSLTSAVMTLFHVSVCVACMCSLSNPVRVW